MEASGMTSERDGHILPFTRKTSFYEIIFDSLFFGVKCLVQDITDSICCLADSTTFFGREILESLEDNSEFTSLSEDGVLILYKRLFSLE